MTNKSGLTFFLSVKYLSVCLSTYPAQDQGVTHFEVVFQDKYLLSIFIKRFLSLLASTVQQQQLHPLTCMWHRVLVKFIQVISPRPPLNHC